ncbi:MAG: beta-ketoacyl-ACP synthase 3 [Pirellulaceae bacterium]|nr:beta-ketoacyl-ACP synthase 3 [Pirellulaceae bacterium]
MAILDRDKLLALYRAMAMAQRIDEVELQLTSRGEAFFHVSGRGHESTAALALHLTPADWLHCHYRDKALLLARGVTPADFMNGLLYNASSNSSGRQLCSHLSAPHLNVITMAVPVGNNALQAVGVAEAIQHRPGNPLVLCAVGDGATQEGEFLEAVSEAARRRLPVLFLIEDNQWAISTRTSGQTFFSPPQGSASAFMGVEIQSLDGRDVISSYERFGQIVDQLRKDRQPVLAVMQVERLTSHTNADDQRIYRSEDEIQRATHCGDPVHHLKTYLLANSISSATLDAIDEEIHGIVSAAELQALQHDNPEPENSAKISLPIELTHPQRENRGRDEGPRLVMKDAMREVLRSKLASDDRVTLYGEDIEDPKGDVFGVTKGLSTEFPGRVSNSPLSESTIVGSAVGRAIAGERPVAFLQFADFLPLAYNQIHSELGSIFWRSAGGFQAPVIVMIPCGGYRPGLGPFHSQTLEATMAHTPGVDVFMPSTATDAAGMLNAAFASGRPTLFFYPKSRLNDPEQTAPSNVTDLLTPIGVARRVRSGRDIALVAWGNTVRLCEQTAETLEQVGVETEILDLRSISPWDEHAVLSSVEKTARLIVVHEDSHSCGVGAEIVATVAEKTRMPVAMRRVTRPDTLVPCNFTNHVEALPSYRRVLETACELLDVEIKWEAPAKTTAGSLPVEAVGSGPSDETVTVVEFHVQPGDEVARGDLLATLEATKSVFDLTAPAAGIVETLAASQGDTIAVGQPLLFLECAESMTRRQSVLNENPGTPHLKRTSQTNVVSMPRRESVRRDYAVGMSLVSTVTGSRQVSNEELASLGGQMSAEDILRRTGIESRHWAQPGETAVSMAVQACWQLLDQEQLIVDDLDAVICATTSPTMMTPSMACQVLSGLVDGRTPPMLQAYDINAACSGYLYTLQSAYDYLQSRPRGRVLVVTSELLSPLLDMEDVDTAIIFGDAASATLLYGEEHLSRAAALVRRPDLSAKGENGTVLSVPFRDHGFIQMQGRRVFSEAVRTMISSLSRVCEAQEISQSDLRIVVPHQANGRIIDAMQNRVDVDVFSNIRHHGNTSSTSIPLCLVEVLPTLEKNDRVALCAFGGGFTFGAGILEAA